MIDSCVRLTLDIQETSMPVAIKTKRGDTNRKLLISLSDGGIPYHITEDCYAVFTALKADGTKIHNPCTIENCVITYQFTEQTCAAVGRMVAEIKLYGANKKLITSASFLIHVFDTVFTEGDEVSSEGEMNTLDALISETVGLINEVQDKLEKGEFVGATGPAGPQGPRGEGYVLTAADKTEIAEMAAELVDVPGSGGAVDLTGVVKTVNGDAPDEDGNVDVLGISFVQTGMSSNGLTDYQLHLTDGQTLAWGDGKNGEDGKNGSAVYLWDSSVESLGNGRYPSSSVTTPEGVYIKNGDIVISKDGGAYLVTNCYLSSFEPVFQFNITSSGEREILYVNVLKDTGGTVTADRTSAEIWDAASSGKMVYCIYSDMDTGYLLLQPLTGSQSAVAFGIHLGTELFLVAIEDDQASVSTIESPGRRGTGILRVSTSTTSASGTGTTGIAIKYKIPLETVKAEAGVDTVLVGDTVLRSYYIYPVAMVDDVYVYLGSYTSIRGATGATGATGLQGNNGTTPHIGANGNWFIGEIDTGVCARGTEVLIGKGKETDGRNNVTIKTVAYLDDGTPVEMVAGTIVDGENGPAGYTPVKGTDYWTETDKAEMVNDVLAALPTWTGGSY